MKTTFHKLLISTTLTVTGAGLIGCSTNAGNGALIGGAAGAGAGALLARRSPVGGAIIGGALGAVTGAIIGNQVDREQDRDRYAYGPPPGEVIVQNPDGSEQVIVQRDPYDPGPPPAPYMEVAPPPPYPSAYWVRGYWVLHHRGYYWVPGYWR